VVKPLNAKPFLHETPHGRLDQRKAFVLFKVSTTVACCVVVNVAKNALAKQTTFDAIVDEVEQPVVVLASITVNEKLQLTLPNEIANAAVPAPLGVPEIV
jgi:hypothetical protein